jgi:hypothetical protein
LWCSTSENAECHFAKHVSRLMDMCQMKDSLVKRPLPKRMLSFRQSTDQVLSLRLLGARDCQGYRYMGRILIHHVREHTCVYQGAPFFHPSDHFGVSCSSLGMDSGISTCSSRLSDLLRRFPLSTLPVSFCTSEHLTISVQRKCVLDRRECLRDSAWMFCCPCAYDVLQGLSG